MENASSRQKDSIAAGLAWSFGERMWAQLAATLAAMVLARLLEPGDYGIISIVNVFVSLCSLLAAGGLGTALVRKREADSADFNTAFCLSLGLSAALYLVLFWAAPGISRFYGLPALTVIMRVMGLRLVLAALHNIQQAAIQREMAFRRYFAASLLGTSLSGVLGVAAALTGFGVWALVIQYLTGTLISTGVLLAAGRWRPRLEFCRHRARYIVSFGWKVLAADLVPSLQQSVRSLLIGKVFGSADLAFYDQGNKYPSLLVDNVNSAINRVMLPAYARVQDDPGRLLQILRRSVRAGMFLLTPMLVGCMAVAENFVRVVLTDKWLPCVPFFQIFCAACLTRPLETCCHKMLLAIGRETVPLQIIAAVNGTAVMVLLAAAFWLHSVLWIAWGSLLMTLVSLAGFMTASARWIGYRFRHQMEDVLPSLGVSLLMGVLAGLAGRLPLEPVPSLLLQIGVGVLSYGLLSWRFNRRQTIRMWKMAAQWMHVSSGVRAANQEGEE